MTKRLFVACAASLLAASAASATVTYSFSCITDTNAVNASSGESQLFVDVDPVGPGQVKFTFRNTGPIAMSIADVYFDDGTLLGIASITSSAGVDFSQGSSPPNLPGHNNVTPAFQTTAGFSADSNPPTQHNGVNPGEWLAITFNLIGGQTYADAIAALNTNGDHLRIGIHVQGYGNGGSESFVNNVPTPGASALLALGVLAARRRRR